MMERSAIMTTMGDLKLFGMRSAYDEIVVTAVKRQHQPQRVVSDGARRSGCDGGGNQDESGTSGPDRREGVALP